VAARLCGKFKKVPMCVLDKDLGPAERQELRRALNAARLEGN
jgi:hypothetical protein